MALNPRFLTPAALRRNNQPVGIEQAILNSRMPVNRIPTSIPTEPEETTVKEDAEAKNVGIDVFKSIGTDIGDDFDAGIVSTMATDNPEEVDPTLKSFYDRDTLLAQQLGAIAELTKSETKTDKLYQEILNKKITPEESRKKVNEFFKVDKSKETPVWADVALTIGLSLLRGESGDFLEDIGEAGEKGLAVAREGRKTLQARTDALDKLAFGVFREDEKNRLTTATTLAKQLSETKDKKNNLILKFTEAIQKKEKSEQDFASKKANLIVSTVNTLSNDQKVKALPIIARAINNNTFKGVSIENVPSTVFGLLNNNGLDLGNTADGKNIVESSFTISSEAEFNRYKEQFPDQFEGINFEQGKLYTVEGFSDKSQVSGANRGLVNILGVKSSVGGTDELTRLLAQKRAFQKELSKSTLAPAEKSALEEQLGTINGRIDLLSTRSKPTNYVFVDGQMVAAGEGAAGVYAASQAVAQQADLDRTGVALAQAYGLADGIMMSLATSENPADVVGVVSLAGKGISGLTGQIDSIINLFGENASDNEADYRSGNINDTMLGSTERAVSANGLGSSKYTVGEVFNKLKKLTKGNAQLRSQLMSFAYALAGSRETGKLTDKDVAAALVTFGGGDIAEGKWFASADVLVSGVNQALTTATNDYAIRYNKAGQNAANKRYLREVENLNEDQIKERTTFDVNKFLKENSGIRAGIADRVIYDPTASQLIRMQSLDKYRGGGAGNIDTNTNAQLNFYKTTLNKIAAQTRLDPNSPDYLTQDQARRNIQIFMKSIPEEFRDQLMGN